MKLSILICAFAVLLLGCPPDDSSGAGGGPATASTGRATTGAP